MSDEVLGVVVILSLVVSWIVLPVILKMLVWGLCIAIFVGLPLYILSWDKSHKGQQQQMNFVSKHTNISKQQLQAIFQPKPKPKRSKKPSQQLFKKQPNMFFHGTTFKSGVQIYSSQLWLASDDLKGIWVGDTFDVARKFSAKDGVILVIEVLPPLKAVHPAHKSDGYHVIKIKKAKPGKEYYKIPNLRIVGMLDYNGRNFL